MNHDEKTALQAILQNRQQMYRLLGRLFKTEVDQPLYDALKASAEEETGTDGFGRLSAWVKDPKAEDPVSELAVDFAHTFLGAGIAEGLVSYPFESVYTSRERLVMQDAWEDVCKLYRAHGLERAKDMDMHEDQIGLECEFMAILTGEALDALEANDEEKLAASLSEQLAFIEKHLLNWLPDFTADVEKTAWTEFYKGLAQATVEFVTDDKQFLTELDA